MTKINTLTNSIFYILLLGIFYLNPQNVQSQDLTEVLKSDSVLISKIDKYENTFYNFPIVRDEIDEFYKTREIVVSRVEPWVLEKESNTWSSLYISSLENNIFLNFRTRGLGCVYENSTKMLLLLSDDNILELNYLGGSNCDSQKWVKFRLDIIDSDRKEFLENVLKIISSDIKTVRIETDSKFFDYLPINLSKFENRMGFSPYFYDVLEKYPLSPGISFVGNDINYQKGNGNQNLDNKLEKYDLEYGYQYITPYDGETSNFLRSQVLTLLNYHLKN